MIVVKVPIENSNDPLGCRKAGNAIISLFPNKYTSENKQEIIKGDLNLEEIHLDSTNLSQANKLIYDNSVEIIEMNEKTIFIGGDGSMCYSIGRAFMKACYNEDKNPFLIVFDAHADVGEPSDIPNSRQWLRALIEDGFPSGNIIIIGLRNSNNGENSFLDENKIRVYRMADLDEYQEICDIIMELSRNHQIYLSIDIDVVDSAFVPGTANKESAGITTRQLIYFLQRLNILSTLRVIDINEINPDLDINDQTVKFGAKILGELLVKR